MEDIPKILLAKTSETPDNPDHEETLSGHSLRVFDAVLKLFEYLNISKCMNVQQIDLEIVKKMLTTCALLHDIGKANNVFQGMLKNDREFNYILHPITHDILTALLITTIDNPIKAILGKYFSTDFIYWISWIAGGHHLRLHLDPPIIRNESQKLVRQNNIPKKFTYYGSHKNVIEIVDKMRNLLNPDDEGPYKFNNLEITIYEDDDINQDNINDIVNLYIQESQRMSQCLKSYDKSLLAILKALLISADGIGSAKLHDGISISNWIDISLSTTISENDLDNVINHRLRPDSHMNSFQNKVAESDSRATILLAGCGTGKTIAAYAWAKRYAGNRKIIFCYPTTGTTSAGFEDYLLAQTDIERAMIHSRSFYDIEKMRDEYPEYFDDPTAKTLKYESLQAWTKQIIVCTTDTILGIIQNHRTGLYSFPPILSSGIVFDEVHSYDSKLFGALLRFLEIFSEIPVLIMSASVTNSRIERLKKVLDRQKFQIFYGDENIESIKRYILEIKPSKNDCWNEVENALQNKKKVLWVNNTVKSAINSYLRAKESFSNYNVILYHSRFRYNNRVQRQSSVLSSFKKDEPVLVISTQVCEMSLDISSDLLITELSPFPFLVQRLGRLNRHIKYNNENVQIAKCIIYFPEKDYPYFKEDLDVSKKQIEKLLNRPINQKDLSDAIKDIPDLDKKYQFSAWIDGDWQSDERPLRESDMSLTIILKEDIEQISRQLAGKKPNSRDVIAWTLPIVYKNNICIEGYFAGYPVVSKNNINYDEDLGAVQ